MLIDTNVNNILFCGYPEMVNPIVDPCSSHAQSTPFYRSGYEKLCTILSFAIGLTASRKIELKNGVPFWTHNLLLLALPLLLSKIVIGDIKYYYHSHPHHHHHHPRRRHHRHHCYHYFYHSDYSVQGERGPASERRCDAPTLRKEGDAATLRRCGRRVTLRRCDAPQGGRRCDAATLRRCDAATLRKEGDAATLRRCDAAGAGRRCDAATLRRSGCSATLRRCDAATLREKGDAATLRRCDAAGAGRRCDADYSWSGGRIYTPCAPGSLLRLLLYLIVCVFNRTALSLQKKYVL